MQCVTINGTTRKLIPFKSQNLNQVGIVISILQQQTLLRPPPTRTYYQKSKAKLGNFFLSNHKT